MREEMYRVIEDKGNAHRIPVMFHFWMYANAFGERVQEVKKNYRLLRFKQPDFQVISSCQFPLEITISCTESAYFIRVCALCEDRKRPQSLTTLRSDFHCE